MHLRLYCAWENYKNTKTRTISVSKLTATIHHTHSIDSHVFWFNAATKNSKAFRNKEKKSKKSSNLSSSAFCNVENVSLDKFNIFACASLALSCSILCFQKPHLCFRLPPQLSSDVPFQTFAIDLGNFKASCSSILPSLLSHPCLQLLTTIRSQFFTFFFLHSSADAQVREEKRQQLEQSYHEAGQMVETMLKSALETEDRQDMMLRMRLRKSSLL